MHDFGYTNERTGMVRGWAMAPDSVRAAHEAAFDNVKDLIKNGAVIRSSHFVGRNTYMLDHELTKALEPLEKIVLADGGPSPFGGVVRGDTVDIYTD